MFRYLELCPNSEVAADLPLLKNNAQKNILLVAMLRCAHRTQNGCLN